MSHQLNLTPEEQAVINEVSACGESVLYLVVSESEAIINSDKSSAYYSAQRKLSARFKDAPFLFNTEAIRRRLRAYGVVLWPNGPGGPFGGPMYFESYEIGLGGHIYDTVKVPPSVFDNLVSWVKTITEPKITLRYRIGGSAPLDFRLPPARSEKVSVKVSDILEEIENALPRKPENALGKNLKHGDILRIIIKEPTTARGRAAILEEGWLGIRVRYVGPTGPRRGFHEDHVIVEFAGGPRKGERVLRRLSNLHLVQLGPVHHALGMYGMLKDA